MRTLPPRAAATVVAPRPSTSTASLGAENSARANYNHSRAVLPPPPSSRPNVQQQVQQRENVQRREQQQNAQNVQRSRRITVQSCLSYCRAPPSPPPAAVTVAKSPTAAAPSAGQPAVYLSPLDIADIQQAWNEVYDVLDRVAEDLSRFEASCASQNNSGNDQPTPKPETPNKATRVVSSAESSGSDSGHGDSVDDRVKCEPAIIIGEDSSVDSCDSGARPAADGLADVGRRRSPPCFVGGANMSVRLKRPASAQSRVRVAATFLDRQHLVDSSSSNSSEAPRILRPKSSTTNVQVKSPPPLATAIVANHSNSKSNHSPPSTSTPIGLPPRPLFAVQKRTLTKLPPLEQTISARSSANCSPTQTLRRRASIRSQLHKASNSAASSPVPTAAAANDQHSPPPQSTPTTRPLTQPAQPRTRSRQRSLERPTATISDQRELQKIRTLLAGLDSGRFRSSSALRSRCASVDNVDRRRPASIAAPRGSSPDIRTLVMQEPEPSYDTEPEPSCTTPCTDDDSLELFVSDKNDTRALIVQELVDTEKSYVESLDILVNKYIKPLKEENANIVDASVVDEIFFQIPEILSQHEQFLEHLNGRRAQWDAKQKIGDLLLEAFTKQQIIDTYTAFINNWKCAKEAIKQATGKSAFAKFLENTAREHKGKLTLDALLIMPVQRIPRYELLVKELLKHTPAEHQDHGLLLSAQKEVHELALKINQVEKDAFAHEQTISTKLKLSGADKRPSWAFGKAKAALAAAAERRPPPEFVIPLPIRKTRAGLQFTCAASSLGANQFGFRDVWVCNSDGFIGQVCVLSLQPEPTVTSCNGVCNTRILCVASVPAATVLLSPGSARTSSVIADERLSMSSDETVTTSSGCYSSSVISSGVTPTPSCSTTPPPMPPSSNDGGSNGPGGLPSWPSARRPMSPTKLVLKSPRSPPHHQPLFQLDSDSSDDEDEQSPDDASTGRGGGGSSGTTGSPNHGRCSEQTPPQSSSPTAELVGAESDLAPPTMWLGTEDGSIHVYNCNDNIRIKKNKIKIQLAAPVTCLIYHDNRVFAGLANGQLAVFRRDDEGGTWLTEPHIIELAATSIVKVLPVSGGKLWCATQNLVKVINTITMEVELSVHVSMDPSRTVVCMAAAGLGVWVSTHQSSVIRLYHATSYENLLDIDVKPAVTKMLQGCDDIIRQHKTACLRVTALLACKDLLWIGTSSGVVLTLTLPHLTPGTAKLDAVPHVSGLQRGHTGFARFLTSVETRVAPSKREPHQRQSSTVKLLVVSGGDGYEDFGQPVVGNEQAGRDDSTNHLLLWSV